MLKAVWLTAALMIVGTTAANAQCNVAGTYQCTKGCGTAIQDPTIQPLSPNTYEFVNEHGGVTHATQNNDYDFTVHVSSDWNPEMKATVRADCVHIDFGNGSEWTKVR
jgi:hypothetical protein